MRCLEVLLSSMVIGLMLTWTLGQEAAPGRIRGRVLDLFGNPIIGVEVLISIEGEIQQRLMTDQQGRYESKKLPPGTYTIRATLLGFHPAKSSVYVGPGKQVIAELGLQPGRLGPLQLQPEVTGNVRQTQGKPVEGATVTIVSPFNQEIRAQTETDSSGRFRLQVPEPGQYVLYVSQPTFAIFVNALTISDRATSDPITVQLRSLPK